MFLANLTQIEQSCDSPDEKLRHIHLRMLKMPITKTRLLIVDDKTAVRKSISLLLTEFGFSVRSAAEGFAALRELRDEIPDVLLSDLNMPGMSGFELLRVVRLRFPSILVIAMSGAFSGDEVPSGVAADAFFQKGRSMGILLKTIENLDLMKRRNLLPTRLGAPLAIEGGVLDISGKSCPTMACPECLRTYPQPLYGHGSQESKTNCMYCGGSIQQSVFEALNQAPAQSSYRKARARISVLGESTVGD
jgi:CheY-like chemotaxis protein